MCERLLPTREIPAPGRQCQRPSRSYAGAHSHDLVVIGHRATYQARMPPAAFLAPRGVRRGLLVLTAGLVPDSYRRYPTGPVGSSLSNARGPLALFLPRYGNGGTGRLEDDDAD